MGVHPHPPEPPVTVEGIRHGSYNAYQRHKCRCAECQEFMRTQAKIRRFRPLPTPRKPLKHGTLYVYSHYRCRCDPCREARSAYERQRPARNEGDDIRHGTLSAYNSAKCRCGACKAARRLYDRERNGYKPRRKSQKRRIKPLWYVCVDSGRRFKTHDYLAGQCLRCDAHQDIEEHWERKWKENRE